MHRPRFSFWLGLFLFPVFASISALHISAQLVGGTINGTVTDATGSVIPGRASMGSWITYGLGSENQSMTGFVTISPTQSHGGANNYSSAFLPAPDSG